MLIVRAAALFVSTFFVVVGTSHAFPGLPRLAGDAWRALTHEQRAVPIEGRPDALALYGDRMGHFSVTAHAEGGAVQFVVDSGASYVGLTGEDAATLGIDPAPADFTLEVDTANGALRLAPVVVPELRLGHITLLDVPATVSPKGTLHESLLGMTALSRFTRVEFSGVRMLLVP